MTISPPPSIYLTRLAFPPQPACRYSSSSRNYTRPDNFWGSQPGTGYCCQRRLGDWEGSWRVNSNWFKKRHFFSTCILLETRARKKGHLLPMKTWDFLSGLLEPDLFRLPHTHLPFSLPHIHTSVYIKYFQSFHLLGTQWYFGSRGSCWSCPQWWCTASACCPSHNKGLWLPGIPCMCKDKRLKPFKTV